ncbi:hypothetical protein [Pseudoneobacillus sp. C159]
MGKIKTKDDFIFSINTGEELSNEEFKVELFEYNQDLACDGQPIKIMNNFDDLIRFIEEKEE